MKTYSLHPVKQFYSLKDTEHIKKNKENKLSSEFTALLFSQILKPLLSYKNEFTENSNTAPNMFLEPIILPQLANDICKNHDFGIEKLLTINAETTQKTIIKKRTFYELFR